MTYELGHEGNHEIEETDGLDEGETENGVREELATEGRVAGNTVDEGGEDEIDTDTGTGKTDGGRAHADVLGDLNHGLGDLGRVRAAGRGERLAGGGVHDGGSLLALEAVEACGILVSFSFVMVDRSVRAPIDEAVSELLSDSPIGEAWELRASRWRK